MYPQPAPEISIVLLASDRYSRLKITMARLRDQTIHSAIEVVIVALSPERIEVDPADRAAFHSLRVVKHRGGRQRKIVRIGSASPETDRPNSV
jgi:hypothetical protein